MNSLDQLEAEILHLPPNDRERLALFAWESLTEDNDGYSNVAIDPDGLDIARQRDSELESGQVQPLNREEFDRLAGFRTR